MARIDTFIPELWNARLIYALEKAHVATAFVNRDYEGEIKQKGDTVHINTIGAITVNNYSIDTPITVQTLSTSDQTLVIDQQKYFAFMLDDIDNTQAAGPVIDKAMGRSAYALADVSDQFLFGKMVAGAKAGNVIGTDGSPITLTAANIYEYIVALGEKLDDENVPTVGRKIAINPGAYALLLKDTTHWAPLKGSNDNGTFVNGLVGEVAGFEVYKTNNLVTSASSFAIVASVPEATTYAEQIVKTEKYRPQDSFSDAVKGLHVYGAKVIRPEAVAVLYGDI